MSKELWYSLEIKEQLSNIHGEVVRMIRSRNNYLNGRASRDSSGVYLNKIHDLISMTNSDPKNIKRQKELLDEENELKRWIDKEVDDQYILRYWEQYTNAIS
ncbi:MAG: hypothetical protein K5770_15085 [Lachnospiraceae bacterium]|nr:hypothetical protein [Lachnospiraceae bacterium]